LATLDRRQTFADSVSGRVTRLGEISPKWVIVYFGQLIENYRNNPYFGAAVPMVKVLQ
jgi:hypothetical protein